MGISSSPRSLPMESHTGTHSRGLHYVNRSQNLTIRPPFVCLRSLSVFVGVEIPLLYPPFGQPWYESAASIVTPKRNTKNNLLILGRPDTFSIRAEIRALVKRLGRQTVFFPSRFTVRATQQNIIRENSR